MDERPFSGATRPAAFAALQSFLPRAGARYAARRNFDPGPGGRRNVSLLSGHIRHRLILESEVLDAVFQHHGEADASRFIEELFWRGYFKGWLEHHPSVWADYRAALRGLVDTLETKVDLRDRYEVAVNAATGIGCFDAWTAELVTTGYLHNHARMCFASIWIYTLGLPWQLGADFFYRHLVDGDPASNTLSWRWVCGLHTKGKTYLARAATIAACTGGRFDPGGRLAQAAPPLKEAQIHSLRALPEPEAIPAGVRFGLLVTEEDCTPETLLRDCSPVAVMGGVTTSSRSPLLVGRPAQEFAIEAVADATERAARHFGAPAQSVRSGDWDDGLVAWAHSSELDAVVTAYAPVGPVAERFASARRALADHGVALVQLRRACDSCIWPHATGGYFRMKSRIPDLLRELGLAVAEPESQRAAG